MIKPDHKLPLGEVVQLGQWVENWKTTGPLLEKIRREEIRKMDTYQTLSNLLGPIDYTQEPFRPGPTSGLVQQQAWFKKLKR
jgi:hypothetical protein